MKINKVLIAYLAVCFFWGSTYLAIKIGIKYFPPMFFAGTRFIIAGGVMLIYAKYKQYAMPKNLKALMPIVIVGIFLLTGGNGLVTLAEKTMPSGISSLLIAMVPIYITVIEVIILKRVKLSVSGYFGMIVGLFGVYLLMDPSGNVFDIGAIYLLLAGLLWSIGSVYSKKITKEVHIISNIGFQMLFGGIFLFLISLVTRETITLNVAINGYLALLYLIIFGSIVGYSSYIYILKHWPASRAGTYAYVNPVVAVILGYFMLNETINAKMLFTMGLILLSVYIVQKSKMIQE